MRRAGKVVRHVLFFVLAAASALFLLLTLPADIRNAPERYVSCAPAVQITPLPGMGSSWLLNAGDQAALEQLPGIGAVYAQRIIENRERDGDFYFPEDAMEVKGIGEKRLESILLWLRENPDKAWLPKE